MPKVKSELKRLFPDTKHAIVPAIDTGFYYDYDTEHSFSLEVLKAVVCCIASYNVIKNAIEEKADLIITYEPTTHCDMQRDNEMVIKKMDLLKESGISIYKLHDHTHFGNTDIIIKGVLEKLGWKGTYDKNEKFELEKEMTISDIMRDIRYKVNLDNLRLTGDELQPVKTVSLCVGAWGDDYVRGELAKPGIDLVISGEICEWQTCEFARDYYEAGFKKALLLLGHIGSEKEGMNYICGILKERFKDVEFKYIDSNEVYKTKAFRNEQ